MNKNNAQIIVDHYKAIGRMGGIKTTRAQSLARQRNIARARAVRQRNAANARMAAAESHLQGVQNAEGWWP